VFVAGKYFHCKHGSFGPYTEDSTNPCRKCRAEREAVTLNSLDNIHGGELKNTTPVRRNSQGNATPVTTAAAEPNSFDDLREQIFRAAEVTYKPFNPATDEPEQVVKLPLDALMQLILTHRNAELEKLLDKQVPIPEKVGRKLIEGTERVYFESSQGAVPVSAIEALLNQP